MGRPGYPDSSPSEDTECNVSAVHSVWFSMPLGAILCGAAHNSLRDLLRSHPTTPHMRSSVLQGAAPRELLVPTSARPPAELLEVTDSMASCVKTLLVISDWEHLSNVTDNFCDSLKAAQVEAISRDPRLQLRSQAELRGLKIYSPMPLHDSVRQLRGTAPPVTANSPWEAQLSEIGQALVLKAPADSLLLPVLLKRLQDLPLNSPLPSLSSWLRLLAGTPANLAERDVLEQLAPTQLLAAIPETQQY